MKQLEVQIMGQGYLLGCPEGGEERLQLAVRRVDEAMCKIRDAGKLRARDRIAVLAALNLAFELSERPPAPAAAQAANDSAAASHDAAALPEALGKLISRLDNALAGDGQLL
jgi:cell division protein ZapA